MTKPALAWGTALALTLALTSSNAQANESSSFDLNSPGPNIISQQSTRQSGYGTGFSAAQTPSSKTSETVPGSAPSTWSTRTAVNGAPVTAPNAASAPGKAAAPAAAKPAKTQKPKKEDYYVVQESQPKYARTTGWQKFYDSIKLTGGMDKVPLILTFTNGGAGRPGFAAVRIYLAGAQLATDKDFVGGSLSLKMDGTLTPDDNQLIIQAYGPVGAQIDWKLTGHKPVLTKVDPSPIAIGQKLSITGRHFMATKDLDKVTIGGTAAQIADTPTTKSITVTIPDAAPAGDQDVIVTVAGKASNALKVTIRPVPEVTGCDMVSLPPGQPLGISGKNFAPTASDNVVTIGGTTAQITSASPTRITIIVPEHDWPAWYLPIKVKSFGVDSKGNVTVNLNQRVIQNDGVPEQ